MVSDYSRLPHGLEAPADDGAADHLTGIRLPAVMLPSSGGGTLDLAALPQDQRWWQRIRKWEDGD